MFYFVFMRKSVAKMALTNWVRKT